MMDLVSSLRAQFETYGDSRTFTFLHESGRNLVEEVVTFRDLDRGAREVAAWLNSRHRSGTKASTAQRRPRAVRLRQCLDVPRCGVTRSGRV
jgi:acyl-CoA synthetase (AMP-forming)/AMP-acid ligase II